MAQLFRPQATTIARIVLVGLIAVPTAAIALTQAILRSPYKTDVDIVQSQPVPFSHKHHAGELGIDCRYCHTTVEHAAMAGIPPTTTCMTCHSQLWTNAQILAPVRRSLASDEPIAWNRVNVVPDYVYFNHAVHVSNGVGCSSCHGNVAAMPLMAKAHSFQMQWCLNCHRAPERFLRPEEAVFEMGWQPPSDQEEVGRRLIEEHHIDVAHLMDCSVCHR